MLDPNTNTPREYTDNMMRSFQIPDDAAQDWKYYGENLKALSGKLAFHDAMKPNIAQNNLASEHLIRTRLETDSSSLHDPGSLEGKNLLHVEFHGSHTGKNCGLEIGIRKDTVLTALQSMSGNVPTDLQGMNEMQKKVWSDVKSRATMAEELILDTNAGMLDMMVCTETKSACNNPTGRFAGLQHVSRAEWLASSFRRRDPDDCEEALRI